MSVVVLGKCRPDVSCRVSCVGGPSVFGSEIVDKSCIGGLSTSVQGLSSIPSRAGVCASSCSWEE